MLKHLFLYTFCHVCLLLVFWWQGQQAGCWLHIQDKSVCKGTELIIRLPPPQLRKFLVFGQSFRSQCFGLKYQAKKMVFETEGDKHIPQMLTLRKKIFPVFTSSSCVLLEDFILQKKQVYTLKSLT